MQFGVQVQFSTELAVICPFFGTSHGTRDLEDLPRRGLHPPPHGSVSPLWTIA